MRNKKNSVGVSWELCFMLEKPMRHIFCILTILMTLMIETNFVFGQSEKCDINKLVIVQENMDSLNYLMVEEFLLTFDESCKNNVEYSQWSNELLFKVINKWTSLYFLVLTSKNIINDNYILEEFRNPLFDCNYQKLFNKIEAIDTDKSIQTIYLNSLIELAKLEGIEIKK